MHCNYHCFDVDTDTQTLITGSSASVDRPISALSIQKSFYIWLNLGCILRGFLLCCHCPFKPYNCKNMLALYRGCYHRPINIMKTVFDIIELVRLAHFSTCFIAPNRWFILINAAPRPLQFICEASMLLLWKDLLWLDPIYIHENIISLHCRVHCQHAASVCVLYFHPNEPVPR